ncbi:putative bifunctional diguanylate cyclase/phosphodiesterase [Rhodoferax mekongensis]|uniref:putative bifunctional diguanylate cyclase/phosphodiesterase n=1 Tax=Rhodoferax mekongensis TaxID=3068341 RepID=UPI0028BEE5A8|nr:EAL domain-containing protein [Rhodoferax sp. TBRC 17199]MDT7517041.1 EAL domain-containing protein [Rhodoferax sp. TBRC 17199]
MIDTLRRRRLNQIASIVSSGLTVALIGYGMDGNWLLAQYLVLALASMLSCLVLNAFRKTNAATVVFLVSLTTLSSALMWVGTGINDVALLTFPAILILAALLVPPRIFFLLLGGMFCFLLFITLATHTFSWRVNGYVTSPWEDLRDSLTILTVSGLVVWLILNDLQKALHSLQTQIESLKESQENLTYLSQHDLLTGLPNRSLGRERIERAIALAERQGTSVAVMFVDLDYFKSINDTLGHAAGDEFLKQVAHRLSSTLRQSDIVSRHGGDEFVLALVDPADEAGVSAAAGGLLESLTKIFTVKDTDVSISCSIGVAMYPHDGHDYETLLRHADMAMYQAKESGRNAMRFFDAGMRTAAETDMHLMTGMRTALSRSEFVLHFQPVFNLVDGSLLGAEALVRWQHPERGLIAPAQFIPTAEKTGFIVELGAWVLREACLQAERWRKEGRSDFEIAVNLSVVQFRRGSIEDVVRHALSISGLPPHCLELEITESILVQDTEQFLVSLRGLKALGVKISIDDFGTGYSNLAYLQKFDVDKLKIDQTFVRAVLDGPKQRALVVAIVQMAQSLNLCVHAEGIESNDVGAAMQSLGCEVGQGYWYAKPITAQEFSVRYCGES